MKQTAQAIISDNILQLLDFSNFFDFAKSLEEILTTPVDLIQVQRLIISGSKIDSFAFLNLFPSLQQLSFLACESDKWSDLKGNGNIISLRLHNLKQKKKYLSSIGFVLTFPNLEYLYINMLGLNNFSELRGLKNLHTIFAQCRNGNDIKAQFDFSALEYIPKLKVLSVWMAVDRHRIPAESLIPVLSNPSVSHVDVTQMHTTEEKKLKKLMEKINPKLLETPLSDDDLQIINKQHFAW
ncbi:hypothetical protein I5907_21455 [Panacibacter sp. DH6]|uniref:Leucine-rich repeat domain-containing protein n=1 Tax=Panacibacter microcysteis TaxID=2793269 RepID=A0A931H0M9_9BACT|nr:hypothetical protein [Panacibacter microcysteis]MBG9378814.1 hypothetical protein [Panacibacter microcysteis]